MRNIKTPSKPAKNNFQQFPTSPEHPQTARAIRASNGRGKWDLTQAQENRSSLIYSLSKSKKLRNSEKYVDSPNKQFVNSSAF